MPYHYLEMIRGTVAGRKFQLPDGAVSIGRSSQNTISLPTSEKSVSGHHAILYKSPERILVQDLQSTNGTYVNDERITERDLAPGDILGFGQAGPRLRLIVSDCELDTSAPPISPIGDPTSIKTHEEAAPLLMMSRDATSDEDRKTVYKLRQQPLDLDENNVQSSLTSELEQKLIDKRLGQKDMSKLLKKGDRLEKIISRGNLGETQTSMLRTAFRANKSMRRQMYYIIASIVFVSVAVSSYFGIRAFQYKHIVTKAKTLQRDLNEYDKKIAAAKAAPEQNRQELETLIAKLEQKQKSLDDLKTKMTDDDFVEFYSDPLEKNIDGVLRRFGETDYHIPAEMIDRVKYHIDYYSKNLHSTVQRYLVRKDKYFPMIQRIFKEKNLPIEFAYVSMLESGFNPMALSHAGARGLWQFMPKTGRQFGLKVTDDVDERCDPLKATYAAAEYFKDLVGIFGGKSSVMLCMAAYNAGEGRVMGALRKIDDPMRNRDFWYIYRMGYLAEETNEYIPRVIAFIIISENQAAYGFTANTALPDDSMESEKDFVEFDYRIE